MSTKHVIETSSNSSSARNCKLSLDGERVEYKLFLGVRTFNCDPEPCKNISYHPLKAVEKEDITFNSFGVNA